MKKFLLGIDQGTTGTKVILMDDRGEIHADSYKKHTQYYPKTGWVEHDPEEIWACILAGVEEALKQGGATPVQIEAVGLANQGETVMVWDAGTGRPLHPAIVWSCRRSQEIARRWAEDGDWVHRVTKKTGLSIDPYFCATKIRWLLEEVPEIRERFMRGEARCGTTDAWIIGKMTGGKAFVTDPSTAARTLLYNIWTNDWDRDILNYLEIDRTWLPAVLPTAGVFGETDPAAFCGIRAPIRASLVDQPAALYGQLCLEPGMSKCTYGTGCFVYMNAGDRPPDTAESGLFATIVWHLDGKTVYALDGGVYSAGSAVNWSLESLGLCDSLEQLQAWSEGWVREPPPDGSASALRERLWFVPALSGMGAPYLRPEPFGLFLGLSHATTRADMARAVLEGIAHRVTDVLEKMQSTARRRLSVLKADGGLTRNPYLMQMQADLLGIPVEVEENPHATVRGVAYLTGRACGWWDEHPPLHGEPAKKVYEPRLPEDTRKRLLAQWQKVVEGLLAFYK